MKLLLTNDDGIEAPGLQALFEAARQIGEPISRTTYNFRMAHLLVPRSIADSPDLANPTF
jgi:hypothetical protein